MTIIDQLNEFGNNKVFIALTWTFFHSLWQGALVAIVTGATLLVTKRTKPVLRYQLLCLLLLLLLFTCLLTFWYQFHLPAQQIDLLGSQIKLYSDAQLYDKLTDAMYLRWQLKSLTTRVMGFVSRYTGVITAVWLMFFCIKIAKIGFTLSYTAYIRRHRSVELSPIWIAKLDAFRAQLSIVKPVCLLESALLTIPVVYGHIKPVILIPIGLLSQLPPGQIEAILMHELVHIRRNDYLINLLQQIAEIVLFFNPALLWLSACIRVEREHCCDELAIKKLGNRRHYAQALISFKELSASLPGVVAFTGERSNLLSRIHRIVTKQNYTLNLAEKTALLICGLALLFFFVFNTALSKTNESFPLGKVVTEISEDLVIEGAIQNKKELSFELTNAGLRVGGVRQPAGLWKKLHKKYLKFSPYPIKPDYRNNPDFGIYYNSSTYVYGIGTKPPTWKN